METHFGMAFAKAVLVERGIIAGARMRTSGRSLNESDLPGQLGERRIGRDPATTACAGVAFRRRAPAVAPPKLRNQDWPRPAARTGPRNSGLSGIGPSTHRPYFELDRLQAFWRAVDSKFAGRAFRCQPLVDARRRTAQVAAFTRAGAHFPESIRFRKKRWPGGFGWRRRRGPRWICGSYLPARHFIHPGADNSAGAD